jgi:hypothetical protein
MHNAPAAPMARASKTTAKYSLTAAPSEEFCSEARKAEVLHFSFFALH